MTTRKTKSMTVIVLIPALMARVGVGYSSRV
jgi:hypothetical protein